MPVFLFTDIEGSTRLWERDQQAMALAVKQHDAILSEAVLGAGGRIVKSTGDGVMAVFPAAPQAVGAAAGAQRALRRAGMEVEIRVRMGIHSGPAESRGEDWFGSAVNKASRVADAAHGGQLLLSAEAANELAGDPPDVSLRDLGGHSLRDLEGEHRLFQVEAPGLAGAFPVLRTPRPGPNNLPTPPTRLVGRLAQLRTAHDALCEPGVRMVTLTGTGGLGKTRLALQIATDALGRHPDGVWFVQLAALAGPGSVASAIRATLGLSDRGSDDAIAHLRQQISDRRLLLVLDNFEQLVEEAVVVADLLAACSNLHVLATSRVPLRIRGERVVALPPLSLPELGADPRAVNASDAGRLFVERARDLNPTFDVDQESAPAVASVVRSLEGIPLAIEIAAGRLLDIPLDDLSARLSKRLDTVTDGPRDLPARHQTLRATIQWSWDLLDPLDRLVLRRVAILPGGVRLDAASATADLPGPETDASLERLVLWSLLTRVDSETGARWIALESVREFAVERLAQEDDAEDAERRAAAWMVDAAVTQRVVLNGPRQADAVAWLTEELDNLRFAFRSLIDRRDPGAVRLGDAVGRWWILRGQLREGIDWLEQAIAALEADVPYYRVALASLAALAGTFGDHAKARAVAERAVSLCREASDPETEMVALNVLAAIATLNRQHEEAEAVYRRNRALLMQGENRFSLAVVTNNLGMLLKNVGRMEEALSLHQEALSIFEDLGDAAGRSTSLKFLGSVFRALKRWDEAEDAYVKALKLSDEAGHRSGVPEVMMNLAMVREGQGRFDEARSLLDEADALALEVGSPRSRASAAGRRATLELTAGNPRDAIAHWERAAAILDEAGSDDAERMRQNARTVARRLVDGSDFGYPFD